LNYVKYITDVDQLKVLKSQTQYLSEQLVNFNWENVEGEKNNPSFGFAV